VQGLMLIPFFSNSFAPPSVSVYSHLVGCH